MFLFLRRMGGKQPTAKIWGQRSVFTTVISIFRLHNTSLVQQLCQAQGAAAAACGWHPAVLPVKIRQKDCFHWGIPLSTPGKRVDEQGRETDQAVTDEVI